MAPACPSYLGSACARPWGRLPALPRLGVRFLVILLAGQALLFSGSGVVRHVMAQGRTGAECPVDRGPISCDACRRGGIRLVDALHSLPRLDTSLNAVTPNLGNYRLFTNCSDGDGRSCDLVEFREEGDVSGGPIRQEPLDGYVQGLAGWAVFGLVFAGLSVMFSTLWCIGRYCFLCCARATTCGKRYPTSRRSCWRTCGLGFRPLGKTTEAGWGYGAGRMVAKGLIFVALLLLVVIISIGYTLGVKEFVPSIKSVVSASQGLMDATQLLEDPFAVHIKNAGSITLRGLGLNLLAIAHREASLFELRNNTYRMGDFLRQGVPHSDTLLTTIDRVNSTIVDLRIAATTSLGAVQELNETSVQVVQPKIEVMRDENARLDVLRKVAAETVDITVPTLDRAAEYRARFLEKSTDPLSVSQRLNLTIQQLPDREYVGDTAFAPVGPSLLVLDSGNMFGNENQAFREQLFDRIDRIRLEFIRTDDLDEAADLLALHNQKVRDAIGDRAFYAVNETLLTAFEASQAVTLELNIDVLDDLSQALSVFSAVPAVLAVTSLQDLLNLHTQDKFDVVLSEILNVWTAGKLVPFLLSAFDEAVKLNKTLMLVPESFLLYPPQAADFSETWPPMLNVTQVYDDELRVFAQVVARELQNTSDYIEAYQLAEENARSVNFTDRRALLVDSITKRREIEVETTRTLAVQVGDVIRHPYSQTDDGVVAALRLMKENFYEFIEPQIRVTLRRLEDFSRFRCDRTGAVGAFCDTDDDCFGGDCIGGLPRCKFDFLRECNSDADCRAFDIFDSCLFNVNDFTVLRNSLTWYALIGRPDIAVENQIPQLLEVQRVFKEYPTLDQSPKTQLLAFKDSIEVLPIDDTLAVLDKLEEDIHPDTMTIGRTFTSAANIDSESLKVHPLAPLPANENYNATISRLYGIQNEVFFNEKWSAAVDSYFSEELPRHIEQLSSKSMTTAREEVGLHAMVEQMAVFVDGLTAFANANCDVSTSFNMEKDSRNIRQRLEALSSAEYADGGPVHFIANVLLTEERDRFVSTAEGNLGGVFVEKHWKSGRLQNWGPAVDSPDGPDRVCVTTKCLEGSIDEWANSTNGAGFQFDAEALIAVHKALFSEKTLTASTGVEAISQFLDVGSRSVDNREDKGVTETRETGYFYLYLFPLGSVGLAVIGALMQCKQCSRFQRWPALCSTFLLFMLIPAIFWVAAGVFFPLGILFSDTCASMENVAWKYASGSADHFCETYLSGEYQVGGSCTFGLGSRASKNLTINLLHLSRGILETCDAYSSEFRQAYLDIADAYEDIPVNEVNATLTNFGQLCHPLPEATAALVFASRRLSTNFRSLLDHLSDVYNCETVHPPIIDIRNAVCCNFGNALLIQILSWCAIGVVLCCCGLPGAILGIKRFPNQLWGPDFEGNVTFQPNLLLAHRPPPPPPKEEKVPDVELPWAHSRKSNAEQGLPEDEGSRGSRTGAAAPVIDESSDEDRPLLIREDSESEEDVPAREVGSSRVRPGSAGSPISFDPMNEGVEADEVAGSENDFHGSSGRSHATAAPASTGIPRQPSRQLSGASASEKNTPMDSPDRRYSRTSLNEGAEVSAPLLADREYKVTSGNDERAAAAAVAALGL